MKSIFTRKNFAIGFHQKSIEAKDIQSAPLKLTSQYRAVSNYVLVFAFMLTSLQSFNWVKLHNV